MIGGVVPSASCLAGIVIAIGGVAVTARPTGTAPRATRHGLSVVLAIGAAGGFGLLQYAIAGGSSHSAVMTMVAMRCTSVPLLAIATILALRGRRHRRNERGYPVRIIALIASVGVFDVGANLVFAQATISGQLPVVATLGSLYPAATVVLARVVDRERMSPTQDLGVLGALTGVVLITVTS